MLRQAIKKTEIARLTNQMKPSNKAAKYLCGNVILKQTEELGPLVLGDCNSAMDKKIHKEFNIQTVISIGQ